MGAKIAATIMSKGSTDCGDKIGCHAFNLCCLNALFGGLFDFLLDGVSCESKESRCSDKNAIA